MRNPLSFSLLGQLFVKRLLIGWKLFQYSIHRQEETADQLCFLIFISLERIVSPVVFSVEDTLTVPIKYITVKNHEKEWQSSGKILESDINQELINKQWVQIEYKTRLLPSHSLTTYNVQRIKERNCSPSKLECNNPYNEKNCPEDTTNQGVFDIYM